ncbi:signal recognition particle-docking protein FtsY [archaeon SCG-AAA382B04]|nr:signal recognition particle-docking protein FtsY [archaeon SCG-AAA382B04]
MFEKLRNKIRGFESDVEEKTKKKASLGEKAKKFVKERKVILEEEDLEKPLSELKLGLVESDVDYDVAEKIIEEVKEELVGKEIKWRKDVGEIVEKALKDALLKIFDFQFNFDSYIQSKEKPINILFVGTNGVGKTTTIAKVSKYLMENNYSTVLACGDTFRAGATKQISEHGESLDTKVIKHEKGGDPAAVIYDAVEFAEANNKDVVLGDTAGRMHTDINLMDQIKKIKRVTNPDLVIFVDEAVAGSDAVERAKEFHKAVNIDAVVLTKIDADVSGGSAISITYEVQKPIIFVGTGQTYSDLKKFDSEWFVNQLFKE